MSEIWPKNNYFRTFKSKIKSRISFRGTDSLEKSGSVFEENTGPNRTGYRTGLVNPVSPVWFGRLLIEPHKNV